MDSESIERAFSALDAEKDNREPLNGWATGDYYNSCCTCGKDFLGDKRAVQCASCAYED